MRFRAYYDNDHDVPLEAATWHEAVDRALDLDDGPGGKLEALEREDLTTTEPQALSTAINRHPR